MTPDIAEAWRLLLRSGGQVRAADLAGRRLEPAYLQRRLRAETGLTPKAAARVTRFDRARPDPPRQAAAGAGSTLADIAAACGYYDQAHLAREFRALAGCPPRPGWRRSSETSKPAPGCRGSLSGRNQTGYK